MLEHPTTTVSDQNSPQVTVTDDLPPDDEPLDPTDDASAVVADDTPGGD